MELEGRTALVTGASSGIGVFFAEQLAERGADLVLTARREDRLEALARRLRETHGVKVSVVALDLAADHAADLLYEQTEGQGATIDVLVNNAGFANFDNFVDLPLERAMREIRLNVVALTELTWRFGRAMRERGLGYILNVASVGAYVPVPYYATYGAGKTFVRNFSEALARELHGSGVRVLSLCPGGTATEFWEVAGLKTQSAVVRATMATPEAVARVGLNALFRGRRNVIVGFGNKVNAFFIRLLPRRFLVWMTARTMAAGREGGEAG